MLILGCGNLDRSDDAAGLLVVRKLREGGIEAREHSGDPLDLIEAWSDQAEVVVVDAVVSGAPPGTIIEWDAAGAPLEDSRFRCSSHVLGLAEAVELARVLNRLPPKLSIVGIEARGFDAGGPVSPEVLDAVDQVACKLKEGFR